MQKVAILFSDFADVDVDLGSGPKTANHSETDYVLEDNLLFFDALNTKHKNFPLAPTKEKTIEIFCSSNNGCTGSSKHETRNHAKACTDFTREKLHGSLYYPKAPCGSRYQSY